MRVVVSAALLLTAWPATQAPAGQGGRLAASLPPRYVVSYLVSAGPDSDAWAPSEEGPNAVMPPHPWEWRIYDPLSGSDRLFLKLRSFPVGIRWDSTFASAEFILGKRIARVRWKMGEPVQELADLPSDSSLCDFWMDASGGWHVVTQREVEKSLPDGRQYVANVGTRWDLPRSSARWHAAVVDSQAGGHYGECYVTPRLQDGSPPPKTIRVGSLVYGMSLDHLRVSVLSQKSYDEGGEEWVWVASSTDSTLGLEMGAGFGDSYHALEPVIWVDRRRSRRTEVYPSGRSDSGQVAFEERKGLVLIVSEYDGGYPVVADMRSGQVLFRVDRASARAVWVPIPR